MTGAIGGPLSTMTQRLLTDEVVLTALANNVIGGVCRLED